MDGVALGMGELLMSCVGELWLRGQQICVIELLPWWLCERASPCARAEVGALCDRAGALLEKGS